MFTIHAAKKGVSALLLAVALMVSAGMAGAAEQEHPVIERQTWTFSGLFGKYDDAQLQRGFRVYTDVCSRCHGINRIYFRNLAEPGGPAFPVAAVKALAATFKVDDAPNEEGKVKKRPALLTDPFPSPYKNEQEARFSQNGALPPDLSLITKARSAEAEAPFYRVPDHMIRDILTGYQEGGADYVYAYITGFSEPPAGVKLAEFMNYNKAFPGHQTAMPNPFAGGDGLVEYDDGTPRTVENYARDVTAFLAWAGDPKLEERKRLGLLVIGYLLITVVLLGFAKRRVWRDVH
ncbi:MAG: cytochrome c1 [Hyphomicrobiaceae bacterium]|nr:MAG: cytochrome c1 [Hyphomicrobiaceae bacterium]